MGLMVYGFKGAWSQRKNNKIFADNNYIECVLPRLQTVKWCKQE